MYNHLLFFAYWIVNSIVLFVSSLLIPNHELVLGSWRFSNFEASIYAGFWLTFLIWVWWDFAIARKLSSYRKIVVFSFFLCVNASSILVISRFSYLSGLVLLNFWWAFAIGLVTTFFQKIVWRLIVKKSSLFGWI